MSETNQKVVMTIEKYEEDYLTASLFFDGRFISSMNAQKIWFIDYGDYKMVYIQNVYKGESVYNFEVDAVKTELSRASWGEYKEHSYYSDRELVFPFSLYNTKSVPVAEE